MGVGWLKCSLEKAAQNYHPANDVAEARRDLRLGSHMLPSKMAQAALGEQPLDEASSFQPALHICSFATNGGQSAPHRQ
jgi:hypothetical protein